MTVEKNLSPSLGYDLVQLERNSCSSTSLKSTVSSTNLRDKLQFANSVKRLVFDLTKIPFFKRLIGISRLTVEVLNDHNLFTESNLANSFSSYVKFFSSGHFSELAEAARWCGKMNHLKWILSNTFLHQSPRNSTNSRVKEYISIKEIHWTNKVQLLRNQPRVTTIKGIWGEI